VSTADFSELFCHFQRKHDVNFKEIGAVVTVVVFIGAYCR
jgi:hypothetical protein